MYSHFRNLSRFSFIFLITLSFSTLNVSPVCALPEDGGEAMGQKIDEKIEGTREKGKKRRGDLEKEGKSEEEIRNDPELQKLRKELELLKKAKKILDESETWNEVMDRALKDPIMTTPLIDLGKWGKFTPEGLIEILTGPLGEAVKKLLPEKYKPLIELIGKRKRGENVEKEDIDKAVGPVLMAQVSSGTNFKVKCGDKIAQLVLDKEKLTVTGDKNNLPVLTVHDATGTRVVCANTVEKNYECFPPTAVSDGHMVTFQVDMGRDDTTPKKDPQQDVAAIDKGAFTLNFDGSNSTISNVTYDENGRPTSYTATAKDGQSTRVDSLGITAGTGENVKIDGVILTVRDGDDQVHDQDGSNLVSGEVVSADGNPGATNSGMGTFVAVVPKQDEGRDVAYVTQDSTNIGGLSDFANVALSIFSGWNGVSVLDAGEVSIEMVAMNLTGDTGDARGYVCHNSGLIFLNEKEAKAACPDEAVDRI